MFLVSSLKVSTIGARLMILLNEVIKRRKYLDLFIYNNLLITITYVK